MALSAHFHQDGQPFRLLLDFVELLKSHSGENLAVEIEHIVEEFGALQKVFRLGITHAGLLTI